ncbi:MAG: peptidylprolyl isomerase [Pyrinomonadaceae bacterium]
MKYFASLIALICFAVAIPAQIPLNIGIQILKAEDARRYDKTLEDLMKSPNAEVRERAALAAGRIGRDEAIPALANLLANDASEKVRVMAAFALGEIESVKSADVIVDALRPGSGTELLNENDAGMKPASVVARLVEAAGKIAAVNAKNERSKELGAAILKAVDFDSAKRSVPSTEIIRLGMTAILRAKPQGGEDVARKFLRYSDPAVVADALNTLARLRAKNANVEARELLKTHGDAVVRANAARVLGAAEDNEAVDLLIKAATSDSDSRVRVSAVRALGNLRDERAVRPLEDYQAATITQVIRRDGKSLAATKYYASPPELSEWLEIGTALGNILAGKKNIPPSSAGGTLYESAPPRLLQLIMNAPETSIARAKVDPQLLMLGMLGRFTSAPSPIFKDWRSASSIAQGLGTLATLPKEKYPENLERYKTEAQQILRLLMADKGLSPMAVPDVLTAYAAFKPIDLGEVLRRHLQHSDVQIRATAANLLADLPASKENVNELKAAFTKALLTDKTENDAQLSILDALFKVDKMGSVRMFLLALNAPDYLVRKKAFESLDETQKQENPVGTQTAVNNARGLHRDQVLPYVAALRTKLGQVLNTDSDYRRALSRKNGSVKAMLTTEKGTFTIDFYPEQAPLTVDNFVKLARSKYFNGLEVHRVVPNFVMQDGDPRGDGNGGPGWSIRCEVNMLPYERGAVGMALSGKDTGGSQWFVTHSPQPHLDGGYTVFGRVSEKDMKIVDKIVRGDKILSVKIVGR